MNRFDRFGGRYDVLKAAVRIIHAVLLCVGLLATPASARCVGDANDDGAVTIDELIIAVNNALTGCVDLDLSSADLVRGGLLYDKWWTINGAPQPTETFPLYLTTQGTQMGDTTWRCKECHGWDYRGVDGAYSSGSHFSGVSGVIQVAGSRTNQELFDAIKMGSGIDSEHAFEGSLSDDDVLDLVRFLRDGLVDMTALIDSETKASNGNPEAGAVLYESASAGQCAICHGSDGRSLNFGDEQDPEYLGTLANDNPWETLHKIRWGHPGSLPEMPSGVENGLTLEEQNDILAHSQTLPLD